MICSTVLYCSELSFILERGLERVLEKAYFYVLLFREVSSNSIFCNPNRSQDKPSKQHKSCEFYFILETTTRPFQY